MRNGKARRAFKKFCKDPPLPRPKIPIEIQEEAESFLPRTMRELHAKERKPGNSHEEANYLIRRAGGSIFTNDDERPRPKTLAEEVLNIMDDIRLRITARDERAREREILRVEHDAALLETTDETLEGDEDSKSEFPAQEEEKE